jgi:WD40-like Beta Propeller Repeat
MSRVDELLRDTLGAENADDEGKAWDEVRRRGDQLVRRRRIRRVASVAVLVIALVVVSAAILQRGSGDTSRIAANPTPNDSTIVAAVNGAIVTVDPSDGHVISHLVDSSALDSSNGLVGGVAVSPDGRTVYYTRRSSSDDVRSRDSCASTVVVEHTIATGAERELVYGYYPVISPDGRWIAYTTGECNLAGNFLAITSLATGANYRPYEQLLGKEPSKVQPLAWSPDDQLLWNRFHQGSADQQAYLLTSPPLDHGNEPIRFDTQHLVAAATYLADGHLVVAQSTTDAWTLDVLNTDGSVAQTRSRSTGPAPIALAAAPAGDDLLLTMPDGHLDLQQGSDAPRPLTSAVTSAVWLPPPPNTATTTR